MMTKIPNIASEKIVSTNNTVQSMQRLRLRRFGMSLATYAVVILATFLVTRLGLGEMNSAQWTTYIGIALFGNSMFFVLFYTNANLRFSDPSLTQEQIAYSALWGMVVLYSLPEARPILLLFYLPAFSFGMLRLTRRQYLAMVVCVMGLYAALLGLEYFQDRQGLRIQYELFLFALFGILLTWFAFFGGFVSNIRRHLRAQKIEKENLIIELKDALREVKTLSGLLPICASCKKIRDDSGYWNQIESYISDHSGAEFSHGICPECAEKLWADYIDDDK